MVFMVYAKKEEINQCLISARVYSMEIKMAGGYLNLQIVFL